MSVSSPTAAKTNGLSTLVDTVVAPNEAFERQRSMPTWGWALIVAIVLLLVGTYLQAPAAHHAGVAQVQHMLANNPMYANMSDAQKQKIVERASNPSFFAYVGPVLGLFVAVLLNTLIMLVGNAVGRGEANFKRLWCGSMNIAVPTYGLGAVVLGVIAVIRGADSFSNAFQLVQAVPSLAMLVPGTNLVLVAFLSGISVFTLWGLFLNATMLRVTGKTSAGVAYTFATIVLVLGALVAAAGGAFSHKMGMF